MKKSLKFFVILGLTLFVSGQAMAALKTARYEGTGEVVSVDPVYGRITIDHETIEGLAGDGQTEFFVADAKILKDISKRHRVEFVVEENLGNTEIVSLTVIGWAPPKEEGLLVGQAVQDVLLGTGEVAKAVTSPIPPAHGVVSGAVGATTDTTGAVLENAKVPETKKEF